MPDIVVGNNAGTSGFGISVLWGKGDGRFQNALNAAQGIGTFDMTVGDFNGDGKLDLAVAGNVSSQQNVIQILLGKGDGTFSKGQRSSCLSTRVPVPSLPLISTAMANSTWH